MTITLLAPDGVAVTAQQERQARAAMYGAPSGRPLGGRSGFREGTASNILSATSTTWTLQPCSAMLDPGFSTHQGMYGWSTDVALTGAVTASDANNPRKDLLYIRVNDSSAGDGSGAINANVVYQVGVAGPNPQPPALPARCFEVGVISVPQTGGGSPTVALNTARFVAAGGILPVSSVGERDALVKHDGMTVRRMDVASFPTETWDGTAWRPAMGNRPFGHMGRTGGSQSIGTTPATVVMDAAQALRGGMTFDNATDSLVVPLTGLYQIVVKMYTTGAATGKHSLSVSKVGSGGATIPGCAVQVNKTDNSDWFSTTVVSASLTAGDKLYLAAAASTASATYGSNGYDGTFLEVLYIGS